MSIQELTGKEAQDWIGESQDDEEVDLLQTKFESENWEFQPRESDVIECEKNDQTYHMVLFSYEIGEALTQAYIIWTESDLFPTRGYHYRAIRSEDQTKNWEMTTYYSKEEVVDSQRSIIPRFRDCDDVNWQCMLKIAGGHTTTIAACAACVQSVGLIGCLACLGAVLDRAGSGMVPCEWCND